ncbi:MAG: metalloregulator ArsR/SmtB family transcription factor [Cyanobacteria bacterium P01_F01_bin.53]
MSSKEKFVSTDQQTSEHAGDAGSSDAGSGIRAKSSAPSRHAFSKELSKELSIDERAKLFAALADPTRLRIVETLIAQHEASGSSLAKQMDISLALFCHHSKTLIASGLVKARKQGQTKFLSLNQGLLKQCYEPFGRSDI